MIRKFLTKNIFVVDDFLLPEECRQEINRAQRAGLDPQQFGMRGPTEVRRRAVVDDSAAAEALWARLSPWLPPLHDLYVDGLSPEPSVTMPLPTFTPIGLNARLRYYAYEPGERFPPHIDLSYLAGPAERSFLTVIIYLTDDFTGGSTKFREVDVAPKLGSALVFPHELRHEGTEVGSGWKCVLRTDVMYRSNQQ